MPTFKKHNFFLKKIFSIVPIIIFTLITSCTFQKSNTFFWNKSDDTNELKKLIIPKGISIPSKNQEYSIPYTQEELNKKNHDIFPPI